MVSNMENGWIKEKEILIVDDEIELLTMLRSIFERAGYTHILTATSGEEAWKQIAVKVPDMVITDVMMPGMDGFALLQEIRAISKIPVLMLTAKGEAEDRFAGFELGADDYLVKPFLPKELLLRVEAIMKRVYPEENRLIKLGAAIVDLDRAEVKKGNENISLTAKEYGILLKLVENAGRIVTTGALCQTACGELWQGYETTLMTHIRHLREKIEEDPSNPESLLTVKGLGYKLKEIFNMPKIFLNYDQQIEKLKNEKNLRIDDTAYAKDILRQTSYYSLIGGYKDIFKNPTTKKYKDGTRFEDIVELYYFDESLRQLFLRYLIKVENEIKSQVSYYFTEKNGENQKEYLDTANYNYVGKKNQRDINRLIKILEGYVTKPTDYHYINHAQKKYGNVPCNRRTNKCN